MPENYFCGWYFKAQSESKTIAVIAAYHITRGQPSCSVQIITDTAAYNATYPFEEYKNLRGGRCICIGKSRFTRQGIKLDIKTDELFVKGLLRFGEWTPISYDIMGPFALVPFMECRHTVLSMKHTVNGRITLNGEVFEFKNAVGYTEGDRGRSFPSVYAWTQCNFEGGSLMFSAADIPILGLHFTGIIGVIMIGKKQHRIATYLGARPLSIKDGSITVRQGSYTFTATLIKKDARPLNAPVSGSMTRIIHESAACTASYRLTKNGRTLLDITTNKAAFEYEFEG